MKSEMKIHSMIMIIISIIAGLLSTMNVFVANVNDIRFHINDFYMAFLMAGWMLLLQSIIFYDKIENVNTLILISIIIIIFTFIAIRTQFLISDDQYLNGMIPHHSMAILMSEQINKKTKNPEIKQLANHIIKHQQEEINKINNLLKINKNI